MNQTKESLQKKLKHSIEKSPFVTNISRGCYFIIAICILVIGFFVAESIAEIILTVPFFKGISENSLILIKYSILILSLLVLIALIVYALFGQKKISEDHKKKILGYLNDSEMMNQWESAKNIFSSKETKVYESDRYFYIFDHLVSLENIFLKKDISSIRFEFQEHYTSGKVSLSLKNPHLFEIQINLQNNINDPIYLIFHRDTIRTIEDIENNKVIKLLLNFAKYSQKLEITYSPLFADNKELIKDWIGRTKK